MPAGTPFGLSFFLLTSSHWLDSVNRSIYLGSSIRKGLSTLMLARKHGVNVFGGFNHKARVEVPMFREDMEKRECVQAKDDCQRLPGYVALVSLRS